MAKQIIVTQNDYGIELETQFVDDKKKPLDITGYDVRVKIIYDDKTIDTVLAEHKDSVNGIAYIVLEKEHLVNTGLYITVWSVVDKYEHVTAQENVYYFVKDVEGSEDDTPTTDLPIDADGVIDKFKEVDNNLLNLTKHNEVISEELKKVNDDSKNIKVNHLDLNIRDYGAKCDGITDDTNSIKLAIEEAKKQGGKASINLTFGTILISENIVVPPTIKIYGQGIYKTTIKTNKSDISVLDITDEYVYNNEFYDFTIDGSELPNVKGILFENPTNKINDENCKFSNILIVNCEDSVIIGNKNKGNRFENINIEHCKNGMLINGTDNTITNCVSSSIKNNGLVINGSNNHVNLFKTFYCDKDGIVINGQTNTLSQCEAQENGLNGIVVNGFANNIHIISDTNGRVEKSSNIQINGYKNIINGVLMYNSNLDGNIDTHMLINENSVLNSIDIVTHGGVMPIKHDNISTSNKIIINGRKLLKELFTDVNELITSEIGTSILKTYNLYNCPWIINYNKPQWHGCYYKKRILVDGATKFNSYMQTEMRGGASKLYVEFFNNENKISSVSSEEINTWSNKDAFAFLNGDIPTESTHIEVFISVYSLESDGYSEAILKNYGFTMY